MLLSSGYLVRQARLMTKEDFFHDTMKIPRHARMQRNLNRVTFTFKEMKEENFARVTSIARVQMKLDILIVQNISTTANFLNCRTILIFSYV